ncbi:MAG: 4Fe-4S dicluster domain-containing protein [Planctomycetota bacterium]|nr:4Fe-4S dicluster domain-containing protein [Planctomycetota bacterium]
MNLRESIERISGVKLSACYQCGTCSGGCPIVEMMDVAPSKGIYRLQRNDSSVLDATTLWLCAACFTCDTRCPRGLRISAVMEAARALKLRKNIDHLRPESLNAESYAHMPPITMIAAFRKYTG